MPFVILAAKSGAVAVVFAIGFAAAAGLISGYILLKAVAAEVSLATSY